MKITAPIKYPGSKWSYADWICSYMPPHKFYLEPYFGSGAVFFKKEPSAYETINDIDSMVYNFFKVCRESPGELSWLLDLTPFSREEYVAVEEMAAGKGINLTGNPIEDARRFAVRCSQSYGNKLADRVGWKNTKSARGPNNPAIWNRLPDMVLNVAERLKNAQIENTDAIGLISACNSSDCLVYADPPYLGGTRSKRMYSCEMMDVESHEKLLHALLEHKGYVIISGYENDLYDSMLKGWTKVYKHGKATNGGSRTEVLWMDYEIQTSLFNTSSQFEPEL